jgi:hypothetical protein
MTSSATPFPRTPHNGHDIPKVCLVWVGIAGGGLFHHQVSTFGVQDQIRGLKSNCGLSKIQ